MEKPAEILLFDYFASQIELAAAGEVLFDLELHDTIYQKIQTPRGVRISDAFGDIAPEAGGGLKEFDVNVTIAAYVRVDGRDLKARQPAVIEVFAIQQEIYRLLFADQTLGGRVCDSLPGKGIRSYDTIGGNPYAVANVPLVINPS